jgi:gamma-glutamyltranspeptidase/glutathione hydrolase
MAAQISEWSEKIVQGVIAAGHPQTVAAGAEILRQGGNAVDAAVAAAFASFVTEAALVNIGGGGIAQVYNPVTNQAQVFDFFSAMPGLPALSPPDPVGIDFRKVMVDFGPAQQPFYIGRGSVAVPGVVAGLCQMAAELGTMSLPQILAPAIRMAREGVALTPALAYVAHILTPIFTDTSEIAAIYAPNGRITQAGESLELGDLAHTLAQLGSEGPSLFYSGDIAQQILADQAAHRGLITPTDLADYQVHRTGPIQIDYRGYTILLPPPASSGGILIAFSLKLLATIDLTEMAHNSFTHTRLLTEVMRFTNIARAEWETECGLNPTVTPEERARCISRFLADGNLNRYRRQLQTTLTGGPAPTEPDLPKGPASTTHISVADARGMIVGITTSAGESAGFAIGNTGVTLNNMLGEIDLHPHGFHQLLPGQRLMTMMSPALILRHGRPLLAIGSGGSNRLRTAITQVISNFIDFDMALDEAVDAPRLHFEDNALQLEGGIAPSTAAELETAGYNVNLWPDRNMFFGGAHAVARQGAGWTAAGDRRRGGSVVQV